MEKEKREKAKTHGRNLVTSLMKLRMDATKVNTVRDTTGDLTQTRRNVMSVEVQNT
jgi:hypothetical protein